MFVKGIFESQMEVGISFYREQTTKGLSSLSSVSLRLNTTFGVLPFHRERWKRNPKRKGVGLPLLIYFEQSTTGAECL